MQKIRFTDASIAKLKPRGTRYLVRNANLAGHYLRFTRPGTRPITPYTRSSRPASVASGRGREPAET